MEPREFVVSETFVTRRRYFLYSLGATIFIVTFILALLRLHAMGYAMNLYNVLLSAAVSLAVFLIITAPSFYLLRQLRTGRLRLTEEGIENNFGKLHRTVAWNDISEVVVRKSSLGVPRSFAVSMKGKGGMTPAGFEPVQEIVDLIIALGPPSLEVKATQSWVDWDKPYSMPLLIIVVAVVFEVVQRMTGAGIFHALAFISLMMIGVYLVVGGPISKMYPATRKLEVALGIVEIAIAFGLILSL